MSSGLFKVCVLAIVLAVVLAQPLERERRKAPKWLRKVGGAIKNVAVGIKDGAKDVFKWAFHRKSKDVKDSKELEIEAQEILDKSDEAVLKGEELVKKGQNLMERADEIERSVGDEVNKRDDDDDDDGDDDESELNGIRRAVKALREAAKKSIKAGETIISHTGKVAAALTETVQDLAIVLAEGLTEVSGALLEVGESIVKAEAKVQEAKIASENFNDGQGNTIEELEKTGELALEAVETFAEVGERSLNLGQKIVEFGKDVVKVLAKGVKKLGAAVGIQG